MTNVLVRVFPALSALPALLVLLVPASAHAQRNVDIELMLPQTNGADDYVITTNLERVTDYFNLPRCLCAESGLGFGDPDIQFKVRLTVEDMGLTDQADLAVGTACDNADPALRNCETIRTNIDVGSLLATDEFIQVDQMMFPNSTCTEVEPDSNVWILYDDGADGIIDESVTLKDFTEINADAQPPPEPENVSAEGAESAVVVSWELPTSRLDDILFFYVLCMDSEGQPVFEDPITAEYDTTMSMCGLNLGVVDPGTGGDAGPVDAGVADAGTGPDGSVAGGELADLDARYICGRVAASNTSMRIEGLTNGELYDFAIVTVDDARNPTYTYVGQATPKPADDFWEYYDDQGGQAEGGVCLVNSTFGDGSGPSQALADFRDNTLASFAIGRAIIDTYYDLVAPLGVYADRYLAVRIAAAVVLAPFAAFAAFWEYTGPVGKMLALLLLLAWRRREPLRAWLREQLPDGARISPTRAAAAAALLALCWAAAPASAQAEDSSFDPYWENFTPVVDSAPIEPSKWNLGIKMGPYLPDIDSEFGLAEGEMGPFETTFGGGSLMLQFDLDRYFLWPAGQLGVTGSFGLASNTAAAFATCNTDLQAAGLCIGNYADADMDGVVDRAEGDDTSFRLFPMSLGVVYRLTALDDHTPVPLVPYAKAGLSYYLWWVTAPDGSFARKPTDDCADPDDPMLACDGDRALGGSLGVQFSIGLALRAERLDRNAATSLRNEFGVEHAGFFAELTYANVDGFGSDKKLAVGDFTWFAGLNFEF